MAVEAAGPQCRAHVRARKRRPSDVQACGASSRRFHEAIDEFDPGGRHVGAVEDIVMAGRGQVVFLDPGEQRAAADHYALFQLDLGLRNPCAADLDLGDVDHDPGSLPIVGGPVCDLTQIAALIIGHDDYEPAEGHRNVHRRDEVEGLAVDGRDRRFHGDAPLQLVPQVDDVLTCRAEIPLLALRVFCHA